MFVDQNGKLLKVKGAAFPRTKDGRLAYCDYNIARWEARKVNVLKASDPLAKKRAKVEKIKATLLVLEAELAAK